MPPEGYFDSEYSRRMRDLVDKLDAFKFIAEDLDSSIFGSPNEARRNAGVPPMPWSKDLRPRKGFIDAGVTKFEEIRFTEHDIREMPKAKQQELKDLRKYKNVWYLEELTWDGYVYGFKSDIPSITTMEK